MYEVDKINALIEQTQKQKELLLKASNLEESIKSIDETIKLYSTFVSQAELQLSSTLLPEDKEKLDYLKVCLDDFIDLLKDQQKEFNDIKREFKFTNPEDYKERLSYLKNLIKFQDVSQKIKYIEKKSQKKLKKDSLDFEILLSADGRKKKIDEREAEEYRNLVLQKKDLNRQLKKQYPSVIRKYNQEISKKNQYVEFGEAKNTIEVIKEVNLDLNKTSSGYFSQRLDSNNWLSMKKNFKTYLEDNLNIKDYRLINKFLTFFDEGLKYNLDFKLTLFSLGYSQDAIDFITDKFDAGLKPIGINDNLSYKFYTPSIFEQDIVVEEPTENKASKVTRKGKIINFIKKNTSKENKKIIKKGLENVAIFLGMTIITTSAVSQAVRKIPKIVEQIPSNSIESQVDKTNESFITYAYDLSNEEKIDEKDNDNNNFAEFFTVNNNSYIYNNMYDAYDNTNKIEPYYDHNISRKVKAIILKLNNELIYVSTQKDYDSYLKLGANPVAVLGIIDDFTEGFYRIEDTSLLRKGMTR